MLQSGSPPSPWAYDQPVFLRRARTIWLRLRRLADLATESQMIPVRVKHDKISHPIRLVGRVRFQNGPVLLYLLKIIVDFITEDKGRSSANGSLMKSVGGQMQARIPVANPGVGAELEVLFEPKDLFIILERVTEIAHLKDRTDRLDFHWW
jgi:hypothetical protein